MRVRESFVVKLAIRTRLRLYGNLLRVSLLLSLCQICTPATIRWTWYFMSTIKTLSFNHHPGTSAWDKHILCVTCFQHNVHSFTSVVEECLHAANTMINYKTNTCPLTESSLQIMSRMNPQRFSRDLLTCPY